jgi:hypothetical protein
MLVLNLVPEGVSVKACSFINRKDVSHQRTSGLGSINNLWASDEVLQAAYFGFGSDSQRIFLCVTDEENWICLAVMH